MNTSTQEIDAIFLAQKRFFATGETLSVEFRKAQLDKFGNALKAWEKRICDALWTDMHKSYEEAYLTETSIVMGEIRSARKNVGRWSRKEWVMPKIAVMPSMSYVVKEPLGTALIVSPWNYPVQLLLAPLVGAIAAGCTAVLKPSPYVPNVSKVIAEMVSETFDKSYIAVVQGNREVNAVLFDKPFDIIFYTGSPAVAHTVMAAAAKHLTPVVLELGGKSPCIIDSTANVDIAAKRLAWAKTLNSGQTCIAPDYILIHPEVKDAFVKAFAKHIAELHGDDIKRSSHYVRMVNDKAFERVSSYLKDGDIVYGGRVDKKERFIEPTLLTNVSPDAPVMQDEIFGPIFPMVTLGVKSKSLKVEESKSGALREDEELSGGGVEELSGGDFVEWVKRFITSRPKPLALYYYGKESTGWDIIRHTSSGGACINDSVMHIVNTNMPFGGVGNSGMGRYHGRESFEAFSHRRSVLVSPRSLDMPFRYMPYKLFALVKHLV